MEPDLIVFTDEIYENLIYGDTEFHSLAAVEIGALLVAIAYVPVFINQGVSLDTPGNSAVYDPQTP